MDKQISYSKIKEFIPLGILILGMAFIFLFPDVLSDKSDRAKLTVSPWPTVVKELTVEAGSPLPTVADFIQGDTGDAKILSGLDESTDMNTIGDHDITLTVSGVDRLSRLHVVDTTAPVIEMQDVKKYDFEGIDAMDFIASVNDATAVEATFTIEADEEKTGVHKVRVKVTDAGGNSTEGTANLEIVSDHEGPVISGVQDITILVGGTVSYLANVSVKDNFDPDPKLKVDNSEVNTEEPGNYHIIYTAEDAAGNVTQVTSTLHVTRPQPGQIVLTEEMIYAEADKVLAKIITPDMSQYDIAKAIYNWAHGNIAYVHMDNKTDWLKAAWDGLVNKRGDCFVYAYTSKALLDRAGITNMIIHKIPAATLHYWNLIDIGEGWKHFDATRRRDGSLHFYQTQEEIINYSNTHNLSHNYDKELYPDIP